MESEIEIKIDNNNNYYIRDQMNQIREMFCVFSKTLVGY